MHGGKRGTTARGNGGRGREKPRETAIGCKIIIWLLHTQCTVDVEAMAEKLKVDE